ncbi:MAG: glycoside hydrolase [Spirochaetes bacterium]|jgi:spore germination protein YaaH|nr:glycoside hydrolase [Spirochaetota bacterium]
MSTPSRQAALALLVLVSLACSTAGAGSAAHGREKTGEEPVARTMERDGESARPLAFKEVWGYLMKGEERELKGTEPLTDICYFSAPITPKGVLGAVPAPPVPPGALRGRARLHIVITELSNPALTHFCLNPSLPYRKRLVDDIVRSADRYDGVQIDFESVPSDDAKHFHGFLGELKKALPASKTLSVAVPVRRTAIADAYEYRAIAGIVDRVIVMAYDQHWSTSRPGPVGSVVWLKEIIEFAEHRIPRGKLVVGLPLYGRAWQDRTLARALRAHHIDELIESKKLNPSYNPERGCHFEYEEKVRVSVFYDDIESTRRKLQLCRDKNVEAAAFWRIGQEASGLWTHIQCPHKRASSDTARSQNEKEEQL